MIQELFFALPMLSVLMGALTLMFLSHKKNISLKNFNFIAVFFLLVAFISEYLILGDNSQEYLFENIFKHTFILDDFATIFDLMFTAGAILTLLVNSDYF